MPNRTPDMPLDDDDILDDLDDETAEQHPDDLHIVDLPSGAPFRVHSTELDYFNERSRLYQSQNRFENISDLQELDRILMYETLVYRWATALSTGRDYWGEPIDEKQTQAAMKECSTELRQIKKALGLDKSSRDKQRGEDSIDNYLANLRQRALEFGYMREAQLDKALELFNELKALLILHDNCDDIERAEQHCRTEDVLEWIRSKAIPEYDVIDEHFRANQQRYWIRKM